MLRIDSVSNRFLNALNQEAQKLVEPHLKSVRLTEQESIYEQEDLIDHLYFPIDCVISTLALMNDGASVEVSMTGREGVVGVVAALDERTSRNWVRVMIPGRAMSINAETIRELFRSNESVQQAIMSYYRSLLMQTSQRAVCNGRHTILQRLSCWLLMVHDRVSGDDLRLTQETIAGRLGARRAGITQAAQVLQNFNAIRYTRGRIHVTDREILEHEACECYQVFRSELDCFRNGAGGGDTFWKKRIPPRYSPLFKRY